MSKKIKLGMVGAGFMGQIAHLQNFIASPNCEVIALADRRPEQLERVAEKHNISRIFGDHKELLTSDLDIDAVCVITQRDYTAEIALDALKSGRHTFTEKPMAASFDQAKDLVNEARKNRLVYHIGMMRRLDAASSHAKEILTELKSSNEFGKMTYVRVHCFDSNPYCNEDNYISTDENFQSPPPIFADAPAWLPDKEIGNFKFFSNVFCHSINMMRFYLDKNPSKVNYCNLANPSARIICFDYPNLPVLLEAGRSSSRQRDEYIEFYFESGKLRVDYPENLLRNKPGILTLEDFRQGLTKTIHPNWSWAFRNQADFFIQKIFEGDTESIVSGAQTLPDMQLTEDIWRTALKIESPE